MAQQTTRWGWVLGAVVVVVFVLGVWWWGTSSNQVALEPGYSASSTDALASANVPPTTTITPVAKSGSVVSVLADIPDASHFASILSQTGVASQLSGKGPYTLFVPDNEAFALLPTGTVSNLSATQLERLALYHIIVGKAIDVNIQTSGTVQALSKDMLNFSIRQGDKSARINSSVALQEFKASNGVVYLINQVLLPPTQ